MRFSVSLDTAEIPGLFERFVSIVGSEPWLKRVRTLRQQVAANPLLGPFFQERYPLELTAGHLLELLRETGQLRSQLNDLSQYRLFSFVAPLVRIYDGLSEAGRSRLAGMLLDGLKSDRGLAPLQHEIETASHLVLRGFDVTFWDLEKGRGFDFLAVRDGIEIEVECKMASGDIGRRIHGRDMRELSGCLYPVLAEAAERIDGGCLVRVVVPSRLDRRPEFLRAVSERMAGALRDGRPFEGPDPCSVEIQAFDLAGTPFGGSDPGLVTTDAVHELVDRVFGKRNPHVLVLFRPQQRAVIVVVESAQPDRVLRGLMREVKDAAKTQFTKTRPGILAVQFLELSLDGLLELAKSDSTDPARASALQIATNLFFQSPTRSHILSLVYRSRGVLVKHASISSNRVDESWQEQGPAYFFTNPNHPVAGDRRYSVFSLSA